MVDEEGAGQDVGVFVDPNIVGGEFELQPSGEGGEVGGVIGRLAKTGGGLAGDAPHKGLVGGVGDGGEEVGMGVVTADLVSSEGDVGDELAINLIAPQPEFDEVIGGGGNGRKTHIHPIQTRVGGSEGMRKGFGGEGDLAITTFVADLGNDVVGEGVGGEDVFDVEETDEGVEVAHDQHIAIGAHPPDGNIVVYGFEKLVVCLADKGCVTANFGLTIDGEDVGAKDNGFGLQGQDAVEAVVLAQKLGDGVVGIQLG